MITSSTPQQKPSSKAMGGAASHRQIRHVNASDLSVLANQRPLLASLAEGLEVMLEVGREVQ